MNGRTARKLRRLVEYKTSDKCKYEVTKHKQRTENYITDAGELREVRLAPITVRLDPTCSKAEYRKLKRSL